MPYTADEVKAIITQNLPDNHVGAILPSLERSVLNTIVDFANQATTSDSLEFLPGVTPSYDGPDTWPAHPIFTIVAQPGTYTSFLDSGDDPIVVGGTDFFAVLYKAENSQAWVKQSIIAQDYSTYIDIANRLLEDSQEPGATSLNWEDRTLLNSNGDVILAWDDLQMKDASGVLAIDWGVRKLYSPNGAEILSFGENDASKPVVYLGGVSGNNAAFGLKSGGPYSLGGTLTSQQGRIAIYIQGHGQYFIPIYLDS